MEKNIRHYSFRLADPEGTIKRDFHVWNYAGGNYFGAAVV